MARRPARLQLIGDAPAALRTDHARAGAQVYPSMDSFKAAEVFTEINKAEPCRLIDLPMAGASPETRAIIDEAAERMRRKFSGMFMPSVGCRSPHMNIDNLRDQLFQVPPRCIASRGRFGCCWRW